MCFEKQRWTWWQQDQAESLLCLILQNSYVPSCFVSESKMQAIFLFLLSCFVAGLELSYQTVSS